MKKTLMQYIENRITLLDGGMGTMLINSGLRAGEIPDMWNIEHADVVKQIHSRYIEAGSEIIIANTFGANSIKLGDKSLEGRMEEINRLGVRIARDACPAEKFVAGEIGPTGKMVKPMGDITVEQMQEAFLRQAGILVEEGVDAIIIETMFSLDEALAAVRAARQVDFSVPVIASMTYNKTPKGFYTIMGDEAARNAIALADEGADVIGSNCTLGSSDMIELAECFRSATGLPVIIQPNAGQPRIEKTQTYYEQSPEEFASDLVRIVDAGASLVGGCCGTTPEFIRAAANALGR